MAPECATKRVRLELAGEACALADALESVFDVLGLHRRAVTRHKEWPLRCVPPLPLHVAEPCVDGRAQFRADGDGAIAGIALRLADYDPPRGEVDVGVGKG